MRRIVFGVASVGACFGIVSACTQDFETFEGPYVEGGAGSSTSSGGASTSSGSTSSGGTTTSSGGGSSGTPGFDANIDCQAISGSCYQQALPCNQKCGADLTTCTMTCDGLKGSAAKQCRDDCETKQAPCLAQCKTTCQQCAGPQCSNGCP